MSKIHDLKPLADRFAVTWCYDWAGGRQFLDGQADSIEEIDSDLYEVKTSTWALNLEDAELELSKEVHRLTEDELGEDSEPMGMGDPAPGEYVDFEQSHYPLFEETMSLLDEVPESILEEAVETYFDAKDCISDYFTEADPFAFVLPSGLHSTVKAVLERLCSEEAQKLREEETAYELEIRIFDLIVDTDPPFKVKLGQKVEALQAIGKGVALLNGMPSDNSAGSHGRASLLKKWAESMRASGHLVAPVKGVFAGRDIDGPLAVAVFDLSLQESEKAIKSTSNGIGLFIGEDLIPQFIRS